MDAVIGGGRVEGAADALRADVPVGGVHLDRAVDVLQLDRSVTGLGVQRALQAAHFDVAVRGLEARRTGAIGDADGPVGGGQMVHHDAARHLDGELGAVVPAPHAGPDGADGDRVRGVIHLDLQVVSILLGTGGLGAADIDGFLVPYGDLHGAVEAVHVEAAAGLQGVAEVEILVIPLEAAQVLDVAAGEHNQTRGDGGKNELGAHNLPSITLLRSQAPICFTILRLPGGSCRC